MSKRTAVVKVCNDREGISLRVTQVYIRLHT
jgi:hypothetical protein